MMPGLLELKANQIVDLPLLIKPGADYQGSKDNSLAKAAVTSRIP